MRYGLWIGLVFLLVTRPSLADDDYLAGYDHATCKPVDTTGARITGGFLLPWIERARDLGTLDYLEKFEAAGYFADSPGQGPAIRRQFSRLFEEVLAIQRPNGYLSSFYDNRLVSKGEDRSFAPTNRFEFYNFGHFTQATIAWYRVSGDRRYLELAKHTLNPGRFTPVETDALRLEVDLQDKHSSGVLEWTVQ